jgi:cell division protein ZapA
VTIAGHTYRIACGPGEEAHMEGLAALYDSRIEEMRDSFGDIGDMRLHVMAAITLADELTESRKVAEALRQEVAQIKAMASTAGGMAEIAEAQAAEAVARMAERIERIARSLQPAPQPSPGP